MVTGGTTTTTTILYVDVSDPTAVQCGHENCHAWHPLPRLVEHVAHHASCPTCGAALAYVQEEEKRQGGGSCNSGGGRHHHHHDHHNYDTVFFKYSKLHMRLYIQSEATQTESWWGLVDWLWPPIFAQQPAGTAQQRIADVLGMDLNRGMMRLLHKGVVIYPPSNNNSSMSSAAISAQLVQLSKEAGAVAATKPPLLVMGTIRGRELKDPGTMSLWNTILRTGQAIVHASIVMAWSTLQQVWRASQRLLLPWDEQQQQQQQQQQQRRDHPD